MTKFKILTLDCKKLKDGRVEVINPRNSDKFYFLAHYSGKPDYRNKFVTYNCFKFRINWIK